VCPAYNELILKDQKIGVHDIEVDKMHGLGTPEDLNAFLNKVSQKIIEDV
jgi:hypothetical protein